MSIQKIDAVDCEIGVLLKNERLRRGISQAETAKILLISKDYVSKIEKGEREPKEIVLDNIKKFIEKVDLVGTMEVSKNAKLARRYHVLGRVPAGFPQYSEQDVIGEVYRHDLPERAFVLKVEGDSMIDTLHDGDYVAIIENGDYHENNIVVAINEFGESLIKRLRKRTDDVLVLASDNAAYKPIIPTEQTRIIGRVIKAWRDITL